MEALVSRDERKARLAFEGARPDVAIPNRRGMRRCVRTSPSSSSEHQRKPLASLRIEDLYALRTLGKTKSEVKRRRDSWNATSLGK